MNISRRELFYTISMLTVIAVVVFLLNLAILAGVWSVAVFRGHAEVKAISIAQTGKPHYLTCQQKKELLTLLNNGEPFDKKGFLHIEKGSNFQKISLHSYEASSIEITPLGTVNDKMALLVQEGSEEIMLLEKEAGQIQKVLTQACED